MKRSKANLSTFDKKHSKIDLDDVDSWLPPEAQLFLSKAIAARGRRQVAEAANSDDGDSGEWQEMPKVGKDYHLLKELGLLEVGGVESSENESPEGPDESEDPEGEGVSFYY